MFSARFPSILLAVLPGGATALLPVFAKDILLTGPWGLGLLRSAPAVGALLMSLWLARFSVDRKVGRVMFTAVGVFGVATIAFGLSTSFWFSLAVLVVLGAADDQHGNPRTSPSCNWKHRMKCVAGSAR